MSALAGLAARPREKPDLAALLPTLTAAFATTAAAHDRAATLPVENFAILRRHGLLALAAPERLGGGGADLATTRRVIAAVARGEPATALVLTMQYLIHASLDERSGFTEPMKALLVNEAIRDGALINALRVEPDLGTPARGGLPATIARRTAQGWRLDGRKIFSTGSTGLRWMLVWARSDDADPLVGNWLVRADTPGIRVEQSWDHLGLRASASHDVVFENVFVPFEQALEPRPAGAALPFSTAFAAWSAVLTGTIYDAVAQAARDWFVGWLIARQPTNLGASLATLPRFQEIVGAIDGLLLQNRALLDAGAAGGSTAVEAGLIKHLVTENAIAAVDKMVAVAGNAGLTRHNPLERHFRDVLCGRIHTPQGDVALGAAGRAAIAAHA